MTPERLDPFARELLDEELVFEPPPDAAAQARVLQRLDVLLGTTAALAASPQLADRTLSAVEGARATVAPFVAKRSVAFMLTLLGTGAIIGGTATAALMPTKISVVKVPTVVTREVRVTMEPPAQVASPPKAKAAKRAVVATPESTLAAEQALLETVRSALLNKRFDDALSTLSRHERQFPTAALAEEHDALLVQALALAGRESDARLQAAAFRTVYPNSIFLPTIDAILPAP